MDIAKAVRDAAKTKGLSQADICRATGMSDSYMSQLFNGRIPDPKASSVYKIAHALNMTVDELLELAEIAQ
jgi:transcriptional regulator with XRE-family HTH domain